MGLVSDPNDLKENAINYLDYYIPSDDPERASHEFTALLESFKFSKDAAAIERFGEVLTPLLSGDYVIVPFPSSSAGYTDTAVHRLVKQLAARSSRLVDGTECLVRHTSIKAGHKGGRRDVALHKATITAQVPEAMRNATMVVIDDISTTRSSLTAAMGLLHSAGATRVLLLALGRTHRSRLGRYSQEEYEKEATWDGSLWVQRLTAVHYHLPYLGLYRMSGIGRGTIHKLMKIVAKHGIELSSYDHIIEAFRLLQLQDKRIKVPTKRELIESLVDADKSRRELKGRGIKIIELCDPDYPRRLSAIEDAPVVLFAKGDYACVQTSVPVAIVGTRKATPQGLQVAREAAGFYAAKGRTIVSGLALGCDTAAHKGCLAAGGRTVAVLAHGLDMVFPPQNEALAREIVEKGGCLVSEYLPKQEPMNYTFIERDRIQSGLSTGVIVVESDMKGGSMHTARYCLAQGRKLGCMEYSDIELNSEMTLGNKKLIDENGAMPLRDAQDLEKFNELLDDTKSLTSPRS